jgi:potassium-dependent mechanosensitive channel
VQHNRGLSNTIQTTTRYTLVGFGGLLGLSTLGFNLSALALIGGGLSVGIGFGLQELVANFISGILLMFEQTLRVGDVVEVGGQRGVVNDLRMRATVLRTIDNSEIYVPNKTLLTSTVTILTLTDRTVRRVIPVGVSYDSEPTEVRDILLKVADTHGLVLKDPAPVVFFTGFGESSLDFELAVWIGEASRGLAVVSDLRYMIFSEFAKNGIEIPYPQRDLHVRSADAILAALPDANRQPAQSGSHSGSVESNGGEPNDEVGTETVEEAAEEAIEEAAPDAPAKARRA